MDSSEQSVFYLEVGERVAQFQFLASSRYKIALLTERGEINSKYYKCKYK